MILYKEHRKGLFNGYLDTPKMDTVAAIIELEIFGEDGEWFLQTDKKREVDKYDDNGNVTGTEMEIPIGIHKSRLIKWTSNFQLKLFES